MFTQFFIIFTTMDFKKLQTLTQTLLYDPEDWSIVSKEEQKLIDHTISKFRPDDLSVNRVFLATNLPKTPSRLTFVRYKISKKL